MRGLGWLYFEVSGVVFEVLNDARISDSIITNFPAATSGFNADPNFYDDEWLYGYQPQACGESHALVPISVDPPWVAQPAGGEFGGYFVESWEGFPGEYDRTINQRASSFGGANFTPLRPRHLSMTYTVVLVGTSERGLNCGFRYLSGLLMGANNCVNATAFVADEEPLAQDVDGVDNYWKLRNVAVLDMPKWASEPIVEKGCLLRRVTFVLGAEDPHLYRCPIECLPMTAFTVPGPAGDCYTWSEFFCNDDLEGFSCELSSFSGDIPPMNGARCAVIIIKAPDATDSPPMMIDETRDDTRSFRLLPIPAGQYVAVNAATHSIYFTDEDGITVGDDAMHLVDATSGQAPVWPEWRYINGETVTASVRPWRVCDLDGTEARILTVIRLG